MKSDKKQYTKRMTIGIMLLIVGVFAAGLTGCQTNKALSSNGTSSQVTESATELTTEVATEQPAESKINRTVATLKGDYQEVAIDLKVSNYGPITVQKGIPVKFNIRATSDTITACNNTVLFNDFKKEIVLKPGDNIIEFTPEEVGTFSYDCWMGMIYSTIKVVEDINVPE